MATSQSRSSATDFVGNTSVLTGPLQIPGYHFKSETTPSLAHGENVDIAYGFKISSKSPVVAKVSTDSLRFEREFYIMKKLYQYKDGSSYIVRPLEYNSMPSGLTIAIYADEGQSYLKPNVEDPGPKSVGNGDSGSIPGSENTYRSWARLSRSKPTDMFDDNGHSNTTSYDLCTFLQFAIKSTDCLDFSHKCGVIHGEIRLSAFQWDGSDEGHVKMWNFGSGSKSLETYLTSKGWRKTVRNKEFMGILQNLLVYMSPEQTGRTTYAPDHRTDIYSLGVVFFVLLTGRAPFDGGPLEILNGILSRRVPLVHELQLDVPEVLSRIIEKMLHKAPDDRYASARGVRADLTECLNQLKMSKESPAESIPLFPLAQHDIASVFTLPKNIYGREKAVLEMAGVIERSAALYRQLRMQNRTDVPVGLHKHYSRSSNDAPESISEGSDADLKYAVKTGDTKVSSGSPSFGSNHLDESDGSSVSSRAFLGNNKAGTTIVGLYGPAGTGKSTLYAAVQPIARKHGYVALAKFDSRNKVPYITVLRSLSQVLQQILSESEDDIQQFYDHLKTSLGAQFSNIGLLTDFVPELKPLLQSADISTSSTEVQMDNIEAKNRFHKLFVEIFRVVTLWRMTSLFLDDLHQADDPSLELIEALIMGRVNLLMFISYRDQEVTTKLSELLENKIANVHFIKVESLTMDSLTDFICDTLHRPRDVNYRAELTPFADIVFRRTQGNAFYTAQLLHTLERKKLIYFDWEKNQWDYDLREIEDATILGINDSTSQLDVSFMVARLRELPSAGQSLLKWASFVGDTFSWKMIKALMTRMAKDVEEDFIQDKGSADDEDDDKTDDKNTQGSIMSGSSVNTEPHRIFRDKGETPTTTLSSFSSDHDPVSGLQAVLQEGYIMSVDGDEFKWCHDRISQAAAELADPEVCDKIHLSIAQYLMQEEIVDAFLVADHLIKCHDLLMTLEDKRPYRQIMIEAGNKGQSSGAHVMAFAYYKTALRLGNPDEEWNDEYYSATIHLYSNAASLSFIVGEGEKTEELLEVLFKKAKSTLDRIPAFHVQAKYYFSRQMLEEGRESLLACLEELGGERARLDISDEALCHDFDQVEKLIQEIGPDEIPYLPVCEDPILIATMGIMDELIAICYFARQQDEMYYWAVRCLYLSFTQGLTSVTGTSCMMAGIGYAHKLKKFNFAERLGRIGIAVADKHGNNQGKGRAYCMYPCFLFQWAHHHQESMAYIRKGMQYALAAGDRIYTSFYLIQISVIYFTGGHHVSGTIREAAAAYEEIHSWAPTMDPNSMVMCILRAAKALHGQTYYNTTDVFDGDDGFNDAHFTEEFSKYSSNPEMLLGWYEFYKLVPLTLYGHLDAAIQVGNRCIKTIDGHPLMRSTRMMLFYFSLALMDKAREDPTTQEKYLDQVRKNHAIVHEWAMNNRTNFIVYWTLIEAELATFGENPDFMKAGRLYEEAIDEAREYGWYLELCVIHEYAGAFYQRIGFKNVAYGFISKAANLYTCHGSYGKVQHLKSKYADLLTEFDDNRQDFRDAHVQTDPLPIGGEATWSSASSLSREKHHILSRDSDHGVDLIPPVTTEQALMTLDILDMASILKSSQVLSSEVKFHGLLKSMMNIILENSAADCGAIVIKDEKYGICSYGNQEHETAATYDPPKPLSEDDALVSSRIINHTIHTGESVLIHDVEQDTRFAVGPWFDRTGSKSVICMPIIHKITTVGCLFIEGPVGIFTQRHITVLSLLCQQMGISITNAFLFKSVQRVTMANMRMIEMQKQALEEARKSKEAADRATRLREIFLANMSHEIRTPFSGFYGMISLLAETNLDPEQRDLVQTAKESCEMLLQLIDDLLNFSKLQAGKVSLDLSPVILDDAIADVVEILIAMAIQKRINITYTIENDVPPIVITDANRLRQVIINLLGNAIKFTHSGEIIIRCSVDRRNDANALATKKKLPLLIEVIDTGIGINEEQRKVLFVPFSQVDGSTTRKYGGTGLGLSICLQLVQLMSGTIDVSSTPAQGSNFHFSICTSLASEKAEERKKMTDELLQSLRHARILVADKHASTVTMVRKLLPGVAVDGVCTVNELLSYRATDYPIIIVGLFLTHDPEFEEWAEHLYSFLERARCIILIHYPTGAVGELLGKNRLTSASVHSNPRRAIVRMAVPLRRISLLRTLVAMLNQVSDGSSNTPRPSMAARHSSDGNTNKLFTDDEQDYLRTMHVLAAEDNPIAQKLLFKQLTRLGLHVVCANNGLEAVDAWTSHPPGYFKMAFFDHHMPKVS
ncbi:hypothetical protein BJV82DRAFT_522892 [Fennellomyces sp. T-0311]|nr:hypothetical protein BJV82DRAFT_522892 [Fennellomyces sp. T-0311]